MFIPQWRLWDSTPNLQQTFDVEYEDGIVQEVAIDEMQFTTTMESEPDLDEMITRPPSIALPVSVNKE